jgi:hypothetical protein
MDFPRLLIFYGGDLLEAPKEVDHAIQYIACEHKFL